MIPPEAPGAGTRSSTGRAERLAIAGFGALIGFGCLLRFWKLAEDGLWYDELWTVVGASDRPFMEMYREWILGDPHPPGYFLFYFVWLKVFPADEFWSRLPNSVAGLLTVAYLLFGTSRVLSRDERIYAGALASLSYLYIFYAVNVKQYSAALLLVTVATVSFLEIAHDRGLSRRTGIALTGTCVCLAYLDHFGMVYAWVLLGLLALMLRDSEQGLRPLGRVAIALGVAYGPIAYFLRFPFLYSGNSLQSEPASLVSELLPSLFFDDSVSVAGFLVVLGAGLALRGRTARSELRTSRNLRVLSIFGTFTALLLALSLAAPIFVIRYFIVLFPVTLLGVAILAAAAFPLSTGWRVVVPLLFFARAATIDFRAVDGMQRQEWDESVDLVLASAPAPDAVYVLGADPDRSMLDYLRAGDFDGVVYRQNVRFYEYYFRRRGANEIAAGLTVLAPTVQGARTLVNRNQLTGRTVHLLAGHHIQLDEEALWTVQQAARSLETTWLYSTIVYEVTF